MVVLGHVLSCIGQGLLLVSLYTVIKSCFSNIALLLSPRNDLILIYMLHVTDTYNVACNNFFYIVRNNSFLLVMRKI